MATPGIRDLVDAVAPMWLKDGGPSEPTIAGRFNYVFGIACDVLLEKAQQGIKSRFPTECDPSALPYIGADRVIPQGAGEPTASYRLRLQQAFPTWKKAGSPWGVMMNLLPMLLPFTPQMRCVNDEGAWDTFAAGASTQTAPDHVWPKWLTLWNWDGDTYDPHPLGGSPVAPLPIWWRWWLVIFSVSPQAWCGPAPVKGSGPPMGNPGGPTMAKGFNVPASTFQGLRTVLATWNKAGKWCRWLVVSFDATLFDPAQPSDGTHNPDGTFGPWCAVVAGTYVTTRFKNARYVDGAF